MFRAISILIILILWLFIGVFEVYASPPTNFQTTQIIGSGLEGPSGFEIAPDGRIFILEREGKIRIYKDGQLLEEPFANLPSTATGDRGLIGIAFDPNFSINHYVYFYYTALDTRNRLVRFNAEGDIGTDGPVILYETTELSNLLHVGGSIRFGADDKIYLAIGDNGYPPNAQNLTNPYGKILRLNKDGSIPLDNPFVDHPFALEEIWAYGFRNPWRFQFDPVSGRIYGGDVGDFSVEEVNKIVAGGNYGWPICEGVCNNPNYMDPLYYYLHQGESAAVTGGPIYRGNMFPESYEGRLFLGDYAQGFIKTISLDEDGNFLDIFDFDLNAGSVVDLKVASDGSLYYITYYPGRLYRISYSTDNHIPVANAGSDKTKGVEPLSINFTSAGSLDPDGDPLTYFWDFGDGTSSANENPTKIYEERGTYTAQLTVSDGLNSAQAIPIVIQVGLAPQVTIASPLDGANYKASETIHYAVSALDGGGFDIDDGSIVTDIVFHHDTHIHPFINGERGRVGEFTIPNQNHEASANTWFEIKVTATDTNGLSSTKSVNILPHKSTVTLKTVSGGLSILLDGVPHIATYVFEGVVGYFREISTNFIQNLSGVLYQFSHWSNLMPLTQVLATPEDDTTLSAYFETPTQFNGEYFNNHNLEGTAALTRSDLGINFDWDLNAPEASMSADNFSVRWSGVQHFPEGRYEFITTTDDGVRLFIDGNLIIDKWQNQSAVSHSGIVDLVSGDHQIIMEYFDDGGAASAKLIWTKTLIQPQGSGFVAEYFDNKTLTGPAIVTRSETAIDFDWGSSSPDPLIPNSEFSARFTKTDNYSAGVYEFKIITDDGVRLFIDDQLILNRWLPQNTEFTINKLLTAGDHTIKLEYFENFGEAKIKLNYLKVGSLAPLPTPGTGYLVKFWNTPNQIEPPVIPVSEPILTRNDDVIDFDWQSGSPDTLVDINDFVGVWEKTVNFEAKNYRFNAQADDGVRVLIDGITIIDEWHNSTQDIYTFEKLMTAGSHDIRIEYYENEGLASLEFSYESLPTPALTYNGEYFNNKDLVGEPVVTREESSLDFDWQSNSPDPLINTDLFSARWTRLINFVPGDYKFSVTSDDGFRLYIDDQLILDKWILQSGETYEISKPITSGNHTIKIEYFENYGGAIFKFNFEQISFMPTTFFGEYFDNQDLSGVPVLTRDDQQINFIWYDQKPDTIMPEDHFSIRWTKTQQFAAGNYSFTLKSDDGIRFYIDDQLIVDDWNDHSLTLHNPSVDLTAGTHTLKIEYYDSYDSATVVFKQN